MISEETINEVREKSPIVQIIGETVQLQRKGSSYMGLCPFHGEKTPSFSVREEGYYHCFGCGESGNVFSFLMKQRGLSFPEAIQELAERSGITIRYTNNTNRTFNREQANEKKRVEEIVLLAMKFYQYALDKAPASEKSYVQGRGITAEALSEFRLGYAPTEWRSLTDVLRKKGFKDEDIVLAGMARRSPRGEIYDTFRGRLIFPVATGPERIAGFGGRILPQHEDKNSPKYINSPESPIYHKSKILYGVPHATAAIREKRYVYLVEGYMDVISLWQQGVRNVLATCGTAVAEGHVERLKHLCSRVRVVFDGDAAGKKAAGRLFPLFVGRGIDVEVLFLEAGEDPDSLAMTHGSGLEAFLEEYPRLSLLECYLEFLLSSNGIEDVQNLGPALKGKLCQKVVEALTPVQNPIEKDELYQQAANFLMVDSDVFKDIVGSTSAGSSSVRTIVDDEVQGLEEVTSVTHLPPLDKTILQACMVHREELAPAILASPEWCQVLHPASLSFISFMSNIVQSEMSDGEKKGAIQDLLKKSGREWLAHWKAAYKMHNESNGVLMKAFKECEGRLRHELLRRELSRIELDMTSAQEEDERVKLSQRRLELTRRIKLASGNEVGG